MQVRQRAERVVQHNSAMVEKLLKLGGCSFAITLQQEGLPTKVDRVQCSQLL